MESLSISPRPLEVQISTSAKEIVFIRKPTYVAHRDSLKSYEECKL